MDLVAAKPLVTLALGAGVNSFFTPLLKYGLTPPNAPLPQKLLSYVGRMTVSAFISKKIAGEVTEDIYSQIDELKELFEKVEADKKPTVRS